MSPETAEPGPDEAYCSSCGEIINAEAEICPECGVRQKEAQPSGGGGGGGGGPATDPHIRDLKNKARTDKSTAMIVGFLFPFAGYIMVDEWMWVAINLVTFNYLLLGFLIVPFHVKGMIEDAQAELDAQGETW